VGGKCLNCHDTCLTCSNVEATDCRACPDKKYLKRGACVDCLGDCLTCLPDDPVVCTSCLKGYYMTQTKACLPCVSPCLTCENAPDECLSCDTTRLLVDKTCKL
jgi:proprotein convertase subtilisin/kexin type 5